MAKWGSWQDNTRKEKRGDAWRIETYYTCSECGIEGYESDKYCHCCGADMYYSPPQTNADRIRAMSDEELAAELCKSSVYGEKCYECNLNGGGCDTHFGTEACVSIVLEWLKQPSEEEDDA